jgi:hypothetical protein
MKYFLDFDRTIFDTEAFKKDVAERPPLIEVLLELKEAAEEFFSPSTETTRRAQFMKTAGTFASHGRFTLDPEDLRTFLYPDAIPFLKEHDCTIVTYGVRAFITAKVTSALRDFPDLQIVYTAHKKGRTIYRLKEETKERSGDTKCTFVDDAIFQLESVSKWCPDVRVIEIRRDGRPPDGRWDVIASFEELEK